MRHENEKEEIAIADLSTDEINTFIAMGKDGKELSKLLKISYEAFKWRMNKKLGMNWGVYRRKIMKELRGK